MRQFTTPKSPQDTGRSSSDEEEDYFYGQQHNHNRHHREHRQLRQQQQQLRQEQRQNSPSHKTNSSSESLPQFLVSTPSKLSQFGKIISGTPTTEVTESMTPTTLSSDDNSPQQPRFTTPEENSIDSHRHVLNSSSDMSEQGVVLFGDTAATAPDDSNMQQDEESFEDDNSPKKTIRRQKRHSKSSRPLSPDSAVPPLPPRSRTGSSHRHSVSTSSLPSQSVPTSPTLSVPQSPIYSIPASSSSSPRVNSTKKLHHTRSYSGGETTIRRLSSSSSFNHDDSKGVAPGTPTFGMPIERRRSSTLSNSGRASSSYRKSVSLGLPFSSNKSGGTSGGKYSDGTPETLSDSTLDTNPSPERANNKVHEKEIPKRGRSFTLTRSRSGNYTNSVASLTSSTGSNGSRSSPTQELAAFEKNKELRRGSITSNSWLKCNTRKLILIFCFFLGLLSFSVNYLIHTTTSIDDIHNGNSRSRHHKKNKKSKKHVPKVLDGWSTIKSSSSSSSSKKNSSSSKDAPSTLRGKSTYSTRYEFLRVSKPSSPLTNDDSSSVSSSSIHKSTSKTASKKPLFDAYDSSMFIGSKKSSKKDNRRTKAAPRVVILDPVVPNTKSSLSSYSSKLKQKRIYSKSSPKRQITLYPADFTDNTQLYGLLDSDDEALSKMEIREPYSNEECVPMQDWQTTFHPSCNMMHELALEHMGRSEQQVNDYKLFGTGGFWRYAWRLDLLSGGRSGSTSSKKDKKKSSTSTKVEEKLIDPSTHDTVVLKTLKYEHNFEDAHFEHDRIDAVAMERLTSSEHVINIFGFCGHSVMTEFADGKRVGELADKSKKVPLARLKIASDIAHGLADVHGIDGDGNSTFVHLDINPANVVSIGGTLKLNDFNIGKILQWNITSGANKQCGFDNNQYPNPQWRSPEENRMDTNLTEKVDVYSMGHIFFRLICGHEPWNFFEPNGKPEKEVINKKVIEGVLPTIPESIKTSTDKEVIAIRNAMMDCYKYNPNDRPSARYIANKLDDALRQLSESSTTKQVASKDSSSLSSKKKTDKAKVKKSKLSSTPKTSSVKKR